MASHDTLEERGITMETATALTRTENIRKLLVGIFALVIVGLGDSSAFALDQMGPPVAGLKQGQFKAGVDYSYSEMDLELTDGIFVEYLDGALSDTGEATTFTLKDFKAGKVYVNLGYGFADNCEAFLRVGGTKGKFGDSIWLDSEQFDSGSNLAVGGGVKATFFEEGGLKLGALIQGSWAQYQGELDSPNWTGPDFVDIDIAEFQIAVGASYTWEGGISVYGGPFFHFVDGDLDDTVGASITGGGELLNSEYAWDINEDSVFGGYLGIQLEFVEGCFFNVEYQGTAAANGFGASLMWRF